MSKICLLQHAFESFSLKITNFPRINHNYDIDSGGWISSCQMFLDLTVSHCGYFVVETTLFSVGNSAACRLQIYKETKIFLNDCQPESNPKLAINHHKIWITIIPWIWKMKGLKSILDRTIRVVFYENSRHPVNLLVKAGRIATKPKLQT